jgi:hypothetical protein
VGPQIAQMNADGTAGMALCCSPQHGLELVLGGSRKLPHLGMPRCKPAQPARPTIEHVAHHSGRLDAQQARHETSLSEKRNIEA